MRILCVIPFYKPAYIYGGPTRSVPALCEGLANLGEQVTVFTTDANGKERLEGIAGQPQILDGVKVIYFRQDVGGNYFYSAGLARACQATISDYDLVYIVATWTHPFLPACTWARRRQVPYVVSPRTSFMRQTWRDKHLKKWSYFHMFERRLIEHAAALHYTSRLEQRESQWLNLSPEPFVVANPVDVSEFEHLPEKGRFRTEHQIPATSPLLLYLGRLEARKGLNLTLAAFAHLAKSQPDALLVLAGPDKDGYQNILRRQVVEFGLQGRVFFTDYLDAQQRLSALVDADAFVLTSYSDNFGMAAVEALAAGLPVLISNRVGIAEEVAQAGVGLVTKLEIPAIAEGMECLLTLSKNQPEQAVRARQFARERFAPVKVAAEMQENFTQVISR